MCFSFQEKCIYLSFIFHNFFPELIPYHYKQSKSGTIPGPEFMISQTDILDLVCAFRIVLGLFIAFKLATSVG